jgi:hypothetical protein
MLSLAKLLGTANVQDRRRKQKAAELKKNTAKPTKESPKARSLLTHWDYRKRGLLTIRQSQLPSTSVLELATITQSETSDAPNIGNPIARMC